MELSRETELVTRINYLNGKIKKLDEYVQANTIEFNEEKYFFGNVQQRLKLATEIKDKCKNIMDEENLNDTLLHIILGEIQIEAMQQIIKRIDAFIKTKQILENNPEQ